LTAPRTIENALSSFSAREALRKLLFMVFDFLCVSKRFFVQKMRAQNARKRRQMKRANVDFTSLRGV